MRPGENKWASCSGTFNDALLRIDFFPVIPEFRLQYVSQITLVRQTPKSRGSRSTCKPGDCKVDGHR